MQKAILSCSICGKRYQSSSYQQDKLYKCPMCEGQLEFSGYKDEPQGPKPQLEAQKIQSEGQTEEQTQEQAKEQNPSILAGKERPRSRLSRYKFAPKKEPPPRRIPVLPILLVVISIAAGIIIYLSSNPKPAQPEPKPSLEKPPETVTPQETTGKTDSSVLTAQELRGKYQKLKTSPANTKEEHDQKIKDLQQLLDEIKQANLADKDIEEDISDNIQKLQDSYEELVQKEFKSVSEQVKSLEEQRGYLKAKEMLEKFELGFQLYTNKLIELKNDVTNDIDRFTALNNFKKTDEEGIKLINEGKLDEAKALYDKYAESGNKYIIYQLIPERLNEIDLKKTISSVKTTLENVRQPSQSKIEQIKALLLEEQKKEQEKIKLMEQRLVQHTSKSPIRLRFKNPERTIQAKIQAYTPDTITYLKVGGQAPQTMTIQMLHPSTILQLNEIALEKDARGYFELGKIATRNRDYMKAQEYFDKAIKLDEKLKDLLPDIEKIKKKSITLNGDYDYTAGRFSIRYLFNNTDLLNDFEVRNAQATIEEGALKLEGTVNFGIASQWLHLEDEAIAGCELGQAEKSNFVFRVSIITPRSEKVIRYQVEVFTDENSFNLEKKIEGKDKIDSSYPVTKTEFKEKIQSVAIQFNGGKAFLILNNQFNTPQWQGDEEPFVQIGCFAGGKQTSQQQDLPSIVRIHKLEFNGSANSVWMSKLMAEADVLMERELNKELRRQDQQKDESEGEEEEYELLRETTIDPLIEGLPPALREQFTTVKSFLSKYLKNPSVQARDEITQGLEKLIKNTDRFPLAHYFMGILKVDSNDYKGALEHLSKAIDLAPDFAEAHVAKAEAFISTKKYKEALEELKLASQAKADIPEIYSSKSLLDIRFENKNDALDDINIACKLDPFTPGLRNLRRKIKNIIRGPLWSNTYTAETDHYIVKTDISDHKAKFYSNQLEISHEWFEKFFGIQRQFDRKSEVLIFNTNEGYYTYGDFTFDDRMEHTLGVFFSIYQQLLLFEGLKEQETLETLYHEAFHQFLDGIIPQAPPWFNEGMAEYLSAIKVDLARRELIKTAGIHEGRLRNIQHFINMGFTFSFEQIMRYSRSEFYGILPGLQYAQAWSMIHFFYHFDNGRYKTTFETYIKLLMEGKSQDEAYKEAFGVLDLKTAQNEWKQYVKELKEPKD